MHLTRLASLHRLSSDASLLVNALSGAVDLVNNALRTKLLQISLGQQPALPERDRQALTERGYLFESEEAERAALQQVYRAYQQATASRPLQLVVCPTYGCNLACSYCFQAADMRARPEVMTERQVQDLFVALPHLLASRPSKSSQIVLFGGEPLLPATELAVAAILARVEASGSKVQIVTNGFHLERFAALLKRHRAILQGVQITLDGPAAVHDTRRKRTNGQGSFERVVRAVGICLDLGLGVNLRVNLDAQNLGSLEELVQLLQEQGWIGRERFRCQLAPVTDHLGTSTYPFLMTEDELVEPVLGLWRRRPDLRNALDFQLFRVLHHLIAVMEPGQGARTFPRFHYCEAARGEMLAFGPDGLVYVCPESMGTARWAIGTYSPRYRLWSRRLRQWEARSVLDLPECRDCTLATFCGGGCAYAALRRFGSPGHGVCEGAAEVTRAYIGLLGERMSRAGLPKAASA